MIINTKLFIFRELLRSFRIFGGRSPTDMVKITPKRNFSEMTVPRSIPFVIEVTLHNLTDQRDKKQVVDTKSLAMALWKSEWYLQVNTSEECEVSGEKYVTACLCMEFLYPKEENYNLQRISCRLETQVTSIIAA